MDILNQLVGSLSKEELRYFKIFAKRFDVSEERKDFRLLDYIRNSGKKFDDDRISTGCTVKKTKIHITGSGTACLITSATF